MTLDDLFSHKKPPQASLGMQICACPDQSIKGRISMAVFSNKELPFCIPPPPSKVSQWVGIAKSRRGEQKDGFSGSNVLKVTSASR